MRTIKTRQYNFEVFEVEARTLWEARLYCSNRGSIVYEPRSSQEANEVLAVVKTQNPNPWAKYWINVKDEMNTQR